MGEEYEVETILRAKVFKRGKTMGWKYYVKWKGYDASDNTWEPPMSFAGSGDGIVAHFWERVDLEGRDMNDASQFQNGEEVLPRGPPRRPRPSLGKEKTSSRSLPATTPPAKSGGNADDTKSAIGKKPTREKRPRQSTAPEVSTPEPTAKRKRVTSLKKKASTPNVKPKATKKTSPTPVPDSEDELQLLPSAPASPVSPANVKSEASVNNGGKSDSADQVMADGTTKTMDALSGRIRDSDEEDVEQMVVPDLSAFQGRLVTPDILVQSRVTALPTHQTSNVNETDDTSLSGIQNAEDGGGPSRFGPATTRRVAGSRAGPGRNSKGLNARNSSVLVSNKGTLKTLKRKSRKDEAVEDALQVAEHLASEGSRIDSVAFDAPDGATGGTTNVEIALVKGGKTRTPPPTGEQLLHLAGLEDSEAAALPDFEEDQVTHVESGPAASVSALPSTMPTSVKFPEPASKGSSIWTQSTIFGPFALGSATSFRSHNFADVPPTSDNIEPYLLSLDHSVVIPVTLKDVTSATTLDASHLPSVLSPGPKGPPGKLYKSDAAVAVLDALETGGSAARFMLDNAASDQQRKVFGTFRSHLDDGGVFIAMAGSATVACCSGTNLAVAEKLAIPSQLRGLAETVLVSHVKVVNYSAFADVAMRAESVRW
ncbi:hypothetical protein BV25DRAFT_1681797 [Artomyces pyxidatus]|uniref:Uncharacterized protein n=1 Tax=Artomyces pyxidatus TaxID=48021 RepID=A0ACB8TAD5_9AGAM|nr:hypothetical protein BV25DRAFT_1681797 [Artomyces pyxidatus]